MPLEVKPDQAFSFKSCLIFAEQRSAPPCRRRSTAFRQAMVQHVLSRCRPILSRRVLQSAATQAATRPLQACSFVDAVHLPEPVQPGHAGHACKQTQAQHDDVCVSLLLLARLHCMTLENTLLSLVVRSSL